MTDRVRVSVVYYSATGTVAELARTLSEVEKAGADVRLRKVAELAPDTAIDSNPAWRADLNATDDIPVATPDDVVWADAAIQARRVVTMTGALRDGLAMSAS